MSLFRSGGEFTWPIARDEHACSWCVESIAVGEEHECVRWLEEGRFMTQRMHMECATVASKYADGNLICDYSKHQKGQPCPDCLGNSLDTVTP